MSIVNGWTVTGTLVPVTILGLFIVRWLIERGRDRRPLFGERPPDSPEWVQELKPFPGDQPDPAPLPDYVRVALGHDDVDECVTSMWSRAQARMLRDLLRAEEAEEALS